GLRDGGKTVFRTTHYMDEAQALADRVAIISAGEIVASGSPEDVGGDREARTEITFRLPAGVRSPDLPETVRAVARVDAGAVSMSADDPVPFLRDLTVWASDRGVALPDLQVRRPSLRGRHLALTRQTPGTGEVHA